MRTKIFCFFFSIATALIFADEQSARIDALETRMSAIKTETVHRTRGVQLGSAHPQYDGYGLFATADLLFWHLAEGGSDFSLSSKKSKQSDFDWDFGFQVGAGYNFEHDAWDAILNFTWFQTKASDHAHGHNMIPQKGFPFTVNATEISALWRVHYYLLDLELGRSFYVSKFFSLRPQLGVEGAWITQRRHYKIRQPGQGENIYGKNTFWGVGPRAGCEGVYYFGTHFNLFGSLNCALLWGCFTTHTHESVLTGAGKSKLVSVHDTMYRLAPNIQTDMGLGWQSNICDDQFNLRIRLGYSMQYWWRQNQFINEPYPLIAFQHESMDFSLNGLTLDVRFEF